MIHFLEIILTRFLEFVLSLFLAANATLDTATRKTWQALRSVGPLGRSLIIAPLTSTALSQSCSRSLVGWLSSPASIPSKQARPLVVSTRLNGPPKPTHWPYASTDRYSPSMAALPCPRSMNGTKIPTPTLHPIASLLSPTMRWPSMPLSPENPVRAAATAPKQRCKGGDRSFPRHPPSISELKEGQADKALRSLRGFLFSTGL
jgi:hypothetical protein